MTAVKITKAKAELLAQHAIVVQGGFSTPEREKERALKDAENGAVFDDAFWAKIAGEVEQATAERLAALDAEEQEAAAAEGIAPMPHDLVALREEKLKLDDEIDKLQDRLRQIKDTFGERLTADGLVGYQLYGKVHARKSPGTRTGIDTHKLKDELPDVYKAYLKTTPYVSIRIT